MGENSGGSGLVRYSKLQVARRAGPTRRGSGRVPAAAVPGRTPDSGRPCQGSRSNTRTSAMGPVRPHPLQRPMAVVISTRTMSWSRPVSPLPSVHRFELVMAAPFSRPRTVAPARGRRSCGSRGSPRSPARPGPAAGPRGPTWRSSTDTGGGPAAGPGHHAQAPAPGHRSGTRSRPCGRSGPPAAGWCPAAVGGDQREAGAGLHLGQQGVQRHPSQVV